MNYIIGVPHGVPNTYRLRPTVYAPQTVGQLSALADDMQHNLRPKLNYITYPRCWNSAHH